MYNKDNMTKILLVEDDKSLREIYGVRLLAEGYDIVSAGDGEQALAMAIKERPQLIVSDVMMPKISGFDMLDILRSTTETKDIKVIMMTALSSEDQRKRGVALGADRYLVKSQVGIEDVVRTVHEVLGDVPASGGVAQSFSAPRSAASAPAAARPTPTAPHPPRPLASPPPSQQSPASYQTAPSTHQNPPTSSLPQPTAPFSTNRPTNLGERVIHPITPSSSASTNDLNSRIEEELNQAAPQAQASPPSAPASSLPPTPPPPPTPPVPSASPATPSEPKPEETPAAPPSPPQGSGISFEETPLTPPQPPFTPGPQPPRS